jgi:hypothetical protein
MTFAGDESVKRNVVVYIEITEEIITCKYFGC